MSLTVRVIAPVGRDGSLITGVLAGHGIAAEVCDAATLHLEDPGADPIGPLIVAEEALRPSFLQRFTRFVQDQPAWSDLPILLLSGSRTSQARGLLGSPVLLERPLRTDTLISSVRAAVRARKRQYEVRDVLEQRDAALRALEQERQTLHMVLQGERHAKQELKQSVERFRGLLDRASVGISVGDLQGRLSYVNPALLSMLGYTEEQAAAESVPLNDLAVAKDAERGRQVLLQLAATGRAVSYENQFRSRKGEFVPMLVGATMLPPADDGSAPMDVATFFTDLSAQKRAEGALLQSEKLAAVGKLASSISHEINNPLEAITNLLYIVRQDGTLPEETQQYLNMADRELMRVSQVVSQTLRFHRQSTSATTVKPEALLEEVLALYGPRLNNSQIEVQRRYQASVAVTCLEGDIRQVLNNLVGNAIDAMRRGGRLTVRTRVARRPSTGEAGVRLTIADDGAGIDPEARARIFDAFFTTKGIHGTGLGLWISSRIVLKHRGLLRVYSATGPHRHGTVFSLWLPSELASTARDPWNLD